MKINSSKPTNTKLGIFLIVGSVFLMAIQDGLFKIYSSELTLWQVFTLRGIMALPLFYAVAYFQKEHKRLWQNAIYKWSLIRGFCLTLMFMSFYMGLPFLNLSTIAAGIYTGPLFIVLLSALSLKEPVNLRGWIAVLLGFAGVLVILQPGTGIFSFWAALPVLGGFFYALSNIITRRKCQQQSLISISCSLNLVLLSVGIVISMTLYSVQLNETTINSNPFIFNNWTTMKDSLWLLIILLSIFVVIIGMGLAGAYKYANPSIIAIFDYNYLIFALLFDYIVYSVIPSNSKSIGIMMIVVAGMLIISQSKSVSKSK